MRFGGRRECASDPMIVRMLSVWLLGAAFALAIAWRKRADSLHAEAPIGLIATLYSIPALLWLVMNVTTHDDAARVLLELQGIGVRTEANGSIVSRVGGVKEASPRLGAADI